MAHGILAWGKIKFDVKVFSEIRKVSGFRKWWYHAEICAVCFKLLFVSHSTIAWATIGKVVNGNNNKGENNSANFSKEIGILKESSYDVNFVDQFPVRGNIVDSVVDTKSPFKVSATFI